MWSPRLPPPSLCFASHSSKHTKCISTVAKLQFYITSNSTKPCRWHWLLLPQTRTSEHPMGSKWQPSFFSASCDGSSQTCYVGENLVIICISSFSSSIHSLSYMMLGECVPDQSFHVLLEVPVYHLLGNLPEPTDTICLYSLSLQQVLEKLLCKNKLFPPHCLN